MAMKEHQPKPRGPQTQAQAQALRQVQQQLQQKNQQHIQQHASLKQWIESSSKYLESNEVADSVSAAQASLDKLAAWEAELTSKNNTEVAALKELGRQILLVEHMGWRWETPDEVLSREQW